MSSLSQKVYGDSKVHEVFCNCSSENRIIQKDLVKNFKGDEELPLFLNINCLMNVKIKLTQSIWKTNFGKKLIDGSNCIQSQEPLEDGKRLEKAEPENINDSIESRSSVLKKKKDLFLSKASSFPSKKETEAAKNRSSSRKLTAPKKRKIQNAKHKMPKRTKKNCSENQINGCDSSSVKLSVVPSTFLKISDIALTEDKENLESSNENLSVPSSVKNQGLLASFVKNILDNVNSENICEYCEKSFPHLSELTDHRKIHEAEKESCLLCDEVFYRTKDFIEHLRTHEGVDKFSCKMCKKYFPTLKAYKSHYEKVHLVALETQNGSNSRWSQNDDEIRPLWPSTYKCLRCKAEFSSKEEHKNHKRFHQKIDLTGAYLLCD